MSDELARAHRAIAHIYDFAVMLTGDTPNWQEKPRNPEADVIDAIDELVSEQLAIGPVDDYSRDRYPDCDRCPHNWHGIRCEFCECEASTGEVRKLTPEVAYPQYAITELLAHQLVNGVDYDGRGYTLADIEAMRWPRVRFWRTGENGELVEATGTVEIVHAADAALGIMLAELDLSVDDWFAPHQLQVHRERREIQLAIEAGAIDENQWREGDC